MKRKIAAIFAADIAGYSRLVAEDEEETLRRLASYREVIDDFIAKANGRIFNTAGDAVLAEFPSAVDAVRCAIDIQESLRTRNMAYPPSRPPPSRQMSFRIGITIGDVVERNGDLLGDGVNIAARLEGLAEVGGICVSRAVHEQVANKLSVQFADIGAQEVKNIPTPVHAYMVAMRREDGSYSKPQLKKPASRLAAAPVWMWPLVVAVVSVVAIVVTGFLYNTKLKQTATAVATPAATPSAAPSATPTQLAKAQVAPTAPPNAGAAMAPMPAPSPSASPMTGKFAADSVPFINERIRNYLAGDYSAAGDYKAFALNIGGFTGSALNQPNEEAARNAALDQCQKRADAAQSPRRCELYAVGNNVVYTHGKPPMPPSPYFRHDAMTERTFASKDFPMVRDPQKVRLENMFVPAAKSRSVALGPGGQYFMVLGSSSPEESARRALESCGAIAGVACMIVAVDDNFVVPIPTLLRITGFFHAASNASIVADARDEVVRKLADGMGWNAVAVGTAGRPGLGLKAADEQTAVNSALADCARRDSDCHVIAIGPFTVGPTN
ncbi:class 3 adenylate cyclase [Bradyrhizobium japonicum]|uniref:adenylate/guanylate cyclase domain-containing protein n=1 Tax=Bradyrhizobium diazoefficiens TaxID=1355477 RepID=UPI00347A40CB